MTKRKYKPTNKIESLADFERSNATWFEVNKSGRKMCFFSTLSYVNIHDMQGHILSLDKLFYAIILKI